MVSTTTHKILQGLAADSFVPVVFDNTKSGRELYISVHRSGDSHWLRLNPSEQQQVSWQPKFDETCQFKVAKGTNYVFPFMEFTAANSGARVYVCEQPLTGKAPDLATAEFVFDKVEMGGKTPAGEYAVWNQTSVDFFAIPFQLQAGSKNPVGFKDSETRHSILSKLLNTPTPYNQFVFPFGETNPSKIYRIFSPLKGGSFPNPPFRYPSVSGLLEEAITTGLPKLDGVTFNYGGYNMQFGQASGRTVQVTVTDPAGGKESVTLSEITTTNAFMDTIPWSPSNGTGSGAKAAGLIGAAINRGVLYDSKLWGEPKPPNNGYPQDYYVPKPGNASQFNYYSQCLHQASIDGVCYAISYDDFFHQDASVAPKPGEWVRITVLPFN